MQKNSKLAIVIAGVVAIALVALFKLSQQQKLPFVVAWVIGFWGGYILNLFIYF